MLSINRRVSDLRTLVRDWRSLEQSVGFVPTMGALHEGHGALIQRSLERCDRTVVSIFVNPLQFDRAEDLESYPRDERRDVAFVTDLGAHAVFIPAVEELYPRPQLTTVRQSGLTDVLCGAARPGHFEGVLTVVLKLLNLVSPDVAFFGRKDYQQVAVIRRMLVDLAVAIEIEAVETVREADGLALSSRNALLTADHRAAAPRIHESLRAAAARFDDGVDVPDLLLGPVVRELERLDGVRVDYATIVDPDDLEPRTETVRSGDVIAVAAFFGAVRLIDNVTLESPGDREP